MHPEIMKAAAMAGGHIFTENVISLTLAECDDIWESIRQADVALTVSLPRLNMSFIQAAQQLVGDGSLGELALVGAWPCRGRFRQPCLPVHAGACRGPHSD